MDNRFLSANSRAERCFIILTCLVWGSSLFDFVYVAMDKILHTGMFFRTTGKEILFIMLFLLSFNYIRRNVRLVDFVFVLAALLVYSFSPNFGYVPEVDLDRFTLKFLNALPLFFIGLSVNFSKLKNLFWVLSILSIVFGSYYHLVYIQDASYSGGATFTNDNMYSSYTLLLPVVYTVWYTLKGFKLASIETMISLAASVLGIFTISMLGTRGPLFCIFLFILSFVILYKITKHKVLYGLIVLLVILLLWTYSDFILLYLSELGSKLGFSTRIFDSFLSDEGIINSSGQERLSYYPILISALNESPLWGYGIYGSYRFIHIYCHNIFTEILFSFGYIIGGLFICIMGYTTAKGFRNNLTEDQSCFLFILLFLGVISLLFSSIFFINPSFFLFLGYSVKMAYRNKHL